MERNTKLLLSVRMEKCKQAPTYISRKRGLLLCSKGHRPGKDLPDAPLLGRAGICQLYRMA